MAQCGLHVVGGVIDPTFRGEVVVVLKNLGYRQLTIPVKNEDGTPPRVAQLLVLPVPEVVVEWAEELSDSPRGDRGFGSTGV
jgi:dUTP pyrophosphatase